MKTPTDCSIAAGDEHAPRLQGVLLQPGVVLVADLVGTILARWHGS